MISPSIGSNITNNDTTNNQNTMQSMETTQNNLSVLNKDKNEENIAQKSKKKKIIIISLVILGLLVIGGIVLLVGHFAFGWFKKKKEIVVEPKREENYISRYLETKNATNYYIVDDMNVTQKIKNNTNTILTDFIVCINKKNRIDKRYDLNEIDYLYEAFLLIINCTALNETDVTYLGGLNIYDDSKTIDDLLEKNKNLFSNNGQHSDNKSLINNTQNNIPFCKFYFCENGTLDNIYFPLNISEFYISIIEDLIEKVTPKLSKSLYKNETERRRLENGKEGIYLNYEQIYRNGLLKKTIIYENKKEKNIDEDEFIFEKNEKNSKIVRTFDPSGEMTLVEMEGQASFISSYSYNKNIKNNNLRLIEEENEKNVDTNESFYNLGLNEFKMNVTSNMVLIKTSSEPKIMENLNDLSQIINFELYNNESNSNFDTEEGNETEEKTLNESLISTNDTNYTNDINNESFLNKTEAQFRDLAQKNINFVYSYTSYNRVLGTSFLGLYVGLQQNLYINRNNGLRQHYVTLVIGNREYTISTVNLYQYYNSGAKYTTKKVIDTKSGLDKRFKSFGYLIKAELNLKCSLYHGVSIDVIQGEMYTKGFADIDLAVVGSFGPDFIFISFGVSVAGHLAKGNSYIQANTLLNSKSNLARFIFYRDMRSCSVDIEFYFTIWYIFDEETFSETINIFKGFSNYLNVYGYY